MLTLPIKKKWFDMICSGEKKEEYREIKPYYEKRFKNIGLINEDNEIRGITKVICFRNGYNKRSLKVYAIVKLSMGKGKTEWGAEQDKTYFILTIGHIM